MDGAAADVDDGVWREIEDELIVAGMNLLRLRSSHSIDELLVRLLRVERVLTRVEQKPPAFIEKALHPAMSALIKNELLKHPHLNIQFIVASCLNQVTRITAPLQSYPDNQMKDIFRLFMVVLRQLSRLTGDDYDRAVNILAAMARIQTCLVMMDLDIDPIIVDMFRVFFDTIRPNHPFTVFKYMEAIMILVIEQSVEVSVELLKPLLDSVRIDNKVAEELATAAAALCGDGISKLNGSFEVERVGPTLPQVKDGNGNNSISNDDNSLHTVTKRRRRRPNSLMRPEEGYVHIWTTKDRDRKTTNHEFYTGTVEAFDPLTKKHMVKKIRPFLALYFRVFYIKYDDDEEEILNLREERWELFHEKQPRQVRFFAEILV
ncbi:hypothetical protein MIMGU_mgv11b022448mg [Erythranthe guttata]|uniref:Uncharacterized protein n=1 Tax=Erythranthe guttata TaxID=4155 RepID=A0A022QAH9_ERYGU|nr:hypothetical protein MIMGU_mgv11b022448mg [Erythranthe guttata]